MRFCNFGWLTKNKIFRLEHWNVISACYYCSDITITWKANFYSPSMYGIYYQTLIVATCLQVVSQSKISKYFKEVVLIKEVYFFILK